MKHSLKVTLTAAIALAFMSATPVRAEPANPDYEAGAVVLKGGSTDKAKTSSKDSKHHTAITAGSLHE